MFRRKEDTIGPDPVSPADLKGLGFFVNELGHIRMIEAPEKEYIFHATNNERVNELRREAMQECSRQETEKRLALLGIDRIYLPGFTTTKPDGPHVPILAPSPEILKTRKRIVVLVNDSTQDLGILAYRQLQRDLGVNGATTVNFVKELVKRSATGDSAKEYETILNDGCSLKSPDDTPALVVLNTGQLLYSHKHNKAMTMRSWASMPRKSVSHDMIRIHEEENRVQGHRNPKEHVRSVFDSVLCNSERVAPDAEIYVIAIEGGTEYILQLLGEDFEKYGSRITAMALVHSLIDDSQIKDAHIRAFLHQRAREWRFSDLTADPHHCVELPENYPSHAAASTTQVTKHIAWNEPATKTGPLVTVTNALHRLVVAATSPTQNDPPSTTDTATDWSSGQAAICPTFAGGYDYAGECVFTYPPVQHAVLSFFEEVAQDPENYCNPGMEAYTSAPKPTPDSPLVLDPADGNGDVSSLPIEMTPEQADLDEAKEKLVRMELALEACSENVPELQQGRKRLEEKISTQQAKVEKLQKKTLACGGLRAGEAPMQRENWKPQMEGPKVKFAGAEVDSELLKAAGLLDTVEEALKEVGNVGKE